MQVLAHPDPFVLEEELLDRLVASRSEDLLSPVLVLVPTVRLAQHVQRRIAGRLGACLGIDVLHHRVLALRIQDDAPGQTVRPSSSRLFQALLDGVLRGLPENPWARFVRDRPGGLAGLLGALKDLREAAISPARARECLDGERERALAEVYEAYVAALGARASRGLADEAAVVGAALSGASSHASRYAAIFHYGAYELIGVHLDLVRELEKGAPVTFLLPAEPAAAAYEYAESFARAHLLAPGEEFGRIQDRPGALLGDRLADLYDEERRPRSLEGDAVVLRNAQGAVAEVTAGVRSALAAVADGTPSEEIAVVARTLKPFAAALEEVLDDPGHPWTSTLGAPLRRQPLVRDFLLALRAAADDFPRGITAELLRSPQLRWEVLLKGWTRGPAEKAEAWSRNAGIVGGLEEWTDQLVDWAGRPDVRDDATDEKRAAATKRAGDRREEAAQVGATLEALAKDLGPPQPRNWTDHADSLERLLERVFPEEGSSEPARQLLRGLIREMGDLKRRVGDESLVPFGTAVDWLERAVDTAELREWEKDRGGFRVLDAMQARGLTFRRVQLLGFQAGLFPRVPRDDPFLPDAARARLREATGRPLTVKSEGEREERLLLALLLGSARDTLEISWQRSDDDGRARTPSIALREVARVVLGRPDLEGVTEAEAYQLPSHPERALTDRAERFGLLAPEEEILLLALRGAGSKAMESRLRDREPDLDAGLRMLRATESFDPGDLAYDGRVGAGAPVPDPIAVTALERLGRCPLQFFFRHVLGVRGLDEETGPFEISVLEMGQRVHRILERLYERILDDGSSVAAREELLDSQALGWLDELWDEEMLDVAARFGRRAEALWGMEAERWRTALAGFVARDRARIRRDGLAVRGLESVCAENLDFGSGVSLSVHGRFDRVLEGADGFLVGDYKTGANLGKLVDVGLMLKGRQLQVPLYRMLAERAVVEILGVNPAFSYAAGAGEDEARESFVGFDKDEQESGFRETLRVLTGYLRGGTFPLNPDGHCSWCDYRSACRRSHPPTRHREELAPDASDLRGLQGKTKRDKPLLAQVRAATGHAADREEP